MDSADRLAPDCSAQVGILDAGNEGSELVRVEAFGFGGFRSGLFDGRRGDIIGTRAPGSEPFGKEQEIAALLIEIPPGGEARFI